MAGFGLRPRVLALSRKRGPFGNWLEKHIQIMITHWVKDVDRIHGHNNRRPVEDVLS